MNKDEKQQCVIKAPDPVCNAASTSPTMVRNSTELLVRLTYETASRMIITKQIAVTTKSAAGE